MCVLANFAPACQCLFCLNSHSDLVAFCIARHQSGVLGLRFAPAWEFCVCGTVKPTNKRIRGRNPKKQKQKRAKRRLFVCLQSLLLHLDFFSSSLFVISSSSSSSSSSLLSFPSFLQIHTKKQASMKLKNRCPTAAGGLILLGLVLAFGFPRVNAE